MKALRDLTLLCALLLGMLWLATDQHTIEAPGIGSALQSTQLATPPPADALLPPSTSLQSSLPLWLPVVTKATSFIPLHDPRSMADVAPSLNAAQQTAAACQAAEQKRRFLFPFHEFS